MQPPITPIPARRTTDQPVRAPLELAATLATRQPRRPNPPRRVVRLDGLRVLGTPTLCPLRIAPPAPRITPGLQPGISGKRREREPLPAPRAKLVRIVTPARRGHPTAPFTQAGFSRASLRKCPRVAMLKNRAAGVVFGAHGSNVDVVDVVDLGRRLVAVGMHMGWASRTAARWLRHCLVLPCCHRPQRWESGTTPWRWQ
jgi:hypothetical protein